MWLDRKLSWRAEALILLAFGLILSGCAASLDKDSLPSPSHELASTTSDFPGVVRVLGPASCSGTFISQSVVLTAAHCVKGGSDFSVTTYRGKFTTSDTIVLGDGDTDDDKDLALLRFSSPVVDSQEVIPIGNSVSLGEGVYLVGFGCANPHTRVGSGVKRVGSNVIFRISNFLEVMTPNIGDARLGIFGPQNLSGSCFGDSGGPLLVPMDSSGLNVKIVGVDHAASDEGDDQLSQYIDLTREPVQALLLGVDNKYELHLARAR